MTLARRIIIDLRNVALYLQYATELPPKVSRLMREAADELERSERAERREQQH